MEFRSNNAREAVHFKYTLVANNLEMMGLNCKFHPIFRHKKSGSCLVHTAGSLMNRRGLGY